MASPLFDGVTFEPQRDQARLQAQLDQVRDLMTDQQWRTLSQIQQALQLPEGSTPSISARLRDLRKPKFGSFLVERQYVRKGLHVYRVLPPAPLSLF